MKFLVSLATIAVLAISSVSIVSTGAQLPQQTAAVTGKKLKERYCERGATIRSLERV